MAISGGRTFFLVNFGWDYPFYKVRLESCGYILKIPRGTFHRSVSDENGSIVLNQAIRDEGGTVESEFKVTNSKDNKKTQIIICFFFSVNWYVLGYIYLFSFV